MRGGVPGRLDQLPFDGIAGIWAPKIKFWCARNAGRPRPFPRRPPPARPHPALPPFCVCGRDPLGFMGALTEEQKAKKRKAELKNGRLAMIGIISFLVSHSLPGAVPALGSAF